MPSKRRITKQEGKTQLQKNLLVQVFGLTIQKARKDEKKSTAEIAKHLGISDSLYRLIEAGSAVLQPSKALDLISAFPSAKIELRPLCLLLTAIQITENHMESPKEMWRLSTILGQTDPRFGMFTNFLDPIWQELTSGKVSDEIAKKIEETLLQDKLLDFLSYSPESIADQPTSKAKDWAENIVLGTHPIYIDLLDITVAELKNFTPKVNVKSIDKWEQSHLGRFKTIYAVLKNTNVLSETVDDFGWNFTKNENENIPIQIISLADKLQEKKKATEEYLEFLNLLISTKHYKTKASLDVGLDLISREIIMEREEKKSKLVFKMEFVNDKEQHKGFSNMLKFDRAYDKCNPGYSSDTDHRFINFNNAWVYEIKSLNSTNSYHVAFMDNRSEKEKDYECINCLWEDTETWVNLIKKFWNTKNE